MTKKDYIEDNELGQGQSAWFALGDIDARARAAYAAHKDFFESDAHNDRVAKVVAIATPFTKVFNKLYETERASKGEPYTEVKFNKVEFRPGQRLKLNAALEDAGFVVGEFGYRPASESYFIKVK